MRFSLVPYLVLSFQSLLHVKVSPDACIVHPKTFLIKRCIASIHLSCNMQAIFVLASARCTR